MKVSEFFSRFRFKFDDTKLKEAVGGLKNLQTTLDKTGHVAKKSINKISPNNSLVSSLGGLTGGLKAFGAVIAGSYVVNGMRNFINNQAAMNDVVHKASDRLGIEIEELGKLSHAADLSGVKQNELFTSIQRFSRRTADSVNGGPLAATFNQLGVSIKDSGGELKKTMPLFLETLDAIDKRGGTRNEQIALAFKFFDTEGVKLLQMHGKEEIEKAMKEAEELGVFPTKKLVKASAAYNDAHTRMSGAIRGMTNKLLEKLLPILTKMVNFSVNLKLEFARLFDGTDVLTYALYGLGAALSTVALVLSAKLMASMLSYIKVFALATRGAIAFAVANLATVGIWALIIAAGAAIFVFFEDLWVYLNDGESRFASFYDSIGKGITDAFGAMNYIHLNCLNSYR